MPILNPLHPSIRGVLFASAALLGLQAGPAHASSHREAPFIAGEPRLDSTDTYMFRSYEQGRQSYVTLIANYDPLQAPFGGPNYFALDDKAVYDINIDNVGDGLEHITFRFRFHTVLGNLTETVGGRQIGLPIENTGPIGVGNTANQNFRQYYDLTMIRTKNGVSTVQPVVSQTGGKNTFGVPLDNIGNASIPDYPAYAAQFVTNITIPECGVGKVFVGQRKDPFVIGLGQFFDLLNIAHPIGEAYAAAGHDDLVDQNVTSLVMEVPTRCLVDGDPVVGMWTSASKIEPAGGTSTKLVQHSRLGMPLTNELLIAISDKDRWNSMRPVQQDGGDFLKYVTYPSYPAYVEGIFGAAGVRAPTAFPREDLKAVFLTGIPGVNAPTRAHVLADELRLNTTLGITPAGSQHRLGVIDGDVGGFPNGRRPGDDIVDIALRVAMGRLYTLGLFGHASDAPSGALDFTDGAIVNDSFFDVKFPYLRTPIAGSPGPQPH